MHFWFIRQLDDLYYFEFFWKKKEAMVFSILMKIFHVHELLEKYFYVHKVYAFIDIFKLCF